jgi:hypothetical protein
MSGPAPPVRSKTRYGRTAWLVFLAAIVGAGSMFAIIYFSGGNDRNATLRVESAFGWALGAAIVLLLWSVVLAIRALYRNEKSWPPMLLLNVIVMLPALLAIPVWLWPPTPRIAHDDSEARTAQSRASLCLSAFIVVSPRS